MSDKMREAADEVHDELYYMDGAVNVMEAYAGPNAATIDFTLGSPDGSLVEISRFRSTGASNSVITINEWGDVDDFLLRFPPLPADEHPQSVLQEEVREIVDGVGPDFGVRVQINPGTGAGSGDVEAWWPHLIYNLDIAADPVTAGDMIDFLQETYRRYRRKYKEGR